MAERREWDLGAELRAYADRGPRPFDAISIASGAMTGTPGWRNPLRTSRLTLLAAAAVLVAILLASTLLAGGALRQPTTPLLSVLATDGPVPRASKPLETSTTTAAPRRGGPLTFAPVGELDIGPDVAVRLSDGRVLLVGYDDVAPAARLWDPTSGRSTGTGAPAQRYPLAAVVALHDGSALLAGGTGRDDVPGLETYAERYDAVTGTFGFTSKMTAGHGICGCRGAWPHPVGILLRDGRVLIVGGAADPDAEGNPRGSLVIETYDLSSDAFRAIGEIESGTTQLTGVLLGDGRVLLKSMDRAWLVDPDAGSVVDAAPTATTSDRFATVLPDGRVLFTGAGTSTSLSPAPSTRPTVAEIYDPATNTFRALDEQVNPPGTHMGVSAVLRDGRVLFMSKDAAWVFDPASTRFTQIAGRTEPPYEPIVAVSLADGRVLIVADDGRTAVADVAT